MLLLGEIKISSVRFQVASVPQRHGLRERDGQVRRRDPRRQVRRPPLPRVCQVSLPPENNEIFY